MRIGLLGSSTSVGGAEHWLKSLALELARQGEEVTVIVASSHQMDSFFTTEAVFEHVTLPLREVSGGGLVSDRLGLRANDVALAVQSLRRMTSLPRNRRAVRSLLTEHKFDVLHVSNGGYPGSFAALGSILEGARAGIPVVHTIHATPRPRIRLLCGADTRLDAAVQRATAATTTVSSANVEPIKRRGLGPVQVIFPGAATPPLPSKAVARGRLQIPPWQFVMGMVARMAWPKRQEALVEVLRVLVDRGVDAGVVLAGSGPNAEHIARRAQALDVSERVLLVGDRDRYDVLPALDALVHLSDVEAAPLAIIEAICCDIPVVAWDVGGIAELVKLAGADGRIVAYGDTTTLAYLLFQLAESGKHGAATRPERTDRSSVFSLAASADKYRDLYNELMPQVATNASARSASRKRWHV